MKSTGASRREFLKSAGVLIVGFSMAGENGKLAAQNTISPTGLVDATQVDSWITIGADETITVYSGKIEFGQGFSTVQTQLVAEELSVPLNRVTVIFGDTGFLRHLSKRISTPGAETVVRLPLFACSLVVLVAGCRRMRTEPEARA